MKRWIRVSLIALGVIVMGLVSACVGTDTETSIIGLLMGNGTYVSGLAFSANATTYLDGSGNWTVPAGGGGVPGGANTQVQYNDAGVFAGDAGLVYNDALNDLTADGTITSTNGDVVTTTGDINSGNDVNVTNDLDVTDDATIGGDLTISSLLSAGAIAIKPSGDLDDYFTLSTVSDVPTITATGATKLVITSPIGFGASGPLIKDMGSGYLGIKNSADTGYNGLYVGTIIGVGCNLQMAYSSGYGLYGPNGDNGYYNILAKDNGVGVVEIGRLIGAANPYFQFGRDDTGVATNSITNMLVLQAGAGTNNEAAGFGLGVAFNLGNSASEVEKRASIDTVLVTATNGSEDSRFDFSTMTGGSMAVGMSLDRGTLVPSSDNVGSLGTASLRWNLVRAVTITPGDLAWEEWQDPFTSEPFGKGDALVLLVTGVETQEVETIIGHKYETVTKTRPMTRAVYDKDGITVTGSEDFTETYTEIIDIPITKKETIHLTRTVPVRLSTILKYAWAEMQRGNFSRLDGRLDAPNLLTRQSK